MGTVTAMALKTESPADPVQELENRLRQEIFQDSSSPEVYFSLGLVCKSTQRLEEAAQYFAKAIRLKPDYPEAYNSLGLTLCSLNLLAPALECIRQAITLRDDYAEAYNNLGIVQLRLKLPEEALISFQRAVLLEPLNAGQLNNLGLSLFGLERYEEAQDCFLQAVEHDPGYADAHYNLGCTLKELSRPAEAAASFQRAVTLRPDYLPAYEKLSVALYTSNRLAEAESCLRKALTVAPGFADAHRNLGRVLKKMHRLDEAENAYMRAIALNDSDEADDYRYGLGILFLLRGKYSLGWEYYELRRKLFHYPEPEFRYWQGEDLKERSILLFCEQGFGDTVQFIRYAKKVAALAGKTDVRVQAPLRELMELSLPDCTVYSGLVRPSEHYDFTCSLHSLPMIFQSSELTIPEKNSYLSPPSPLVKKWRKILEENSDDSILRAGIVWAGNPKHHNDHNRSVPFRLFKKLLDFTPMTWVSLQTGDRSQDLHQTNRIIFDVSTQLNDYSETAALIQNLDLVITVDSSVAHLTGALGKPVWLLLPFAPDWRWQLDREDTPWYNSVRLFRQEKIGNWSDVLIKVRTELKNFVSTSN